MELRAGKGLFPASRGTSGEGGAENETRAR